MVKPVPQPLADALKLYLHINAMTSNWKQKLVAQLNNPGDPTRALQFRHQLAESILHETITPKQYENLTGEDFDSQADLQVWLRKLWEELYGDQPDSNV